MNRAEAQTGRAGGYIFLLNDKAFYYFDFWPPDNPALNVHQFIRNTKHAIFIKLLKAEYIFMPTRYRTVDRQFKTLYGRRQAEPLVY